MEIWDAYLSDGTLAHRDLARGEPVPPGLYHLVCEALVRHADGDFLLMRRDLAKPLYPGRYEASAGGAALKGEDALDCIRREVFEETGIRDGQFELVGRSVRGNTFYASFVCFTACGKRSITLQKGETIAYKWVSEAEFAAFIRSPEAIDTQVARYAHYFKKLFRDV